MNEKVRLPRLLNADLSEKMRLTPLRGSATLSLNSLSSASLTLPLKESPVSMRDLVELYGPDGSLGIFRVSMLRSDYGGQQEISLEHAICSLEDDLTTPELVLSGDMRAMLSTLLGFQSKAWWALGDVEVSGVLPEMDADAQNLLETLFSVVTSDDSAMLEFDQSAFPWLLHVRKKRETPDCECRLNRNMTGVSVTLDTSELCTKLTAQSDDGGTLTLDAPTQADFGIVHRAITVGEGRNLQTEAQKYLDAHQKPGTSVSINALTLASLTGEPLDRFRLGAMCRVALPAYHTVVNERIVSMVYQDLYGDPEMISLTLSAVFADVSMGLSMARLSGMTSSLEQETRKGLANAFKHITETENAVAIQAEEILLRATHQELVEVNDTLTALYNDVAIEIDGINAQLRLKASQEQLDELSYNVNEVQITLDAATDTVTLLAQRTDKLEGDVSRAEIAIDGLNSEISLKADKIDLEGYVTADALEAELGKFAYSYSEEFDTQSLVAGRINSESGSFDSITTDSLKIGGVDMGTHYHSFTTSGGTVTIGGPTGTPGSFNIADTQFYKDGVSAAEARGARDVSVEDMTATYNPDTKRYSVRITLSNGRTSGKYIDASDAYNAGESSVSVSSCTPSYHGSDIDGCTVTLSNGVSRSYQW